jgi:pyruvate dehydrogenase E2 component (dihydrolipoamide acetyltransferase)
LGEGVTEGELVKWLVKAGDAVNQDQAIAEVMTDKATVEVPSPYKGKVTALRAKEGDTIKVGAVLIEMEAASSAAAASSAGQGASVSSSTPQQPVPAPSRETQKPPVPQATPPSSRSGSPASTEKFAAGATSAGAPMFTRSAPSNGGGIHPPVADSRVLATPSTRRLAREMNVDINNISGTGLAGRVTRQDVLSGGASGGLETYSAPGRTIPRPSYSSHQAEQEERVALKGVRKKIAEKMQLAKQIVPHFTLMDEANVTELVKLRASLKAQLAEKKVKVTYLPFIMKALIATAREFPELNASIDDAASEIVYKHYFNMGFAADTPQGLLVPVIKNADRKSILELSMEIVELSEKARQGKLALEEMRGATMSITNIGSIGGTYATPIINHPEVMIFGMYKISKKAVFDEKGGVKAVDVMNVTVTADHRLIDGAVAARFLKAAIARLENPALLMLDLA